MIKLRSVVPPHLAERVAFLQRGIAERRALADGFRASAIGNTTERAALCLETAKLQEATAAGMESAIAILFDCETVRYEESTP